MSYFNIVAQSSESTVVTEYKPQEKRSEAYQREADLEQAVIRLALDGLQRLHRRDPAGCRVWPL